MADRAIHLVFKTHLDIGFTDHAEKVRAQYHERFIPQAIATAEHFFAENPERPRFIWTTGAWLIWDHLTTQPAERVKQLERAIDLGLIRWHALPFTTHSELMSPALFRAGLSFSQELDQRFDKTTIAAKMTDVPGHTRGIVPLLAEAGVRFLHLGVNAASPVPDVPPVFRWRAPAGEEVVVIYQDSYGGTQFPEGFDEGLSFAHTNDNMGPQSVPQVAEVFRHMQRLHPEAAVRASTLEAFGALAWERREAFPVVDIELGDSWIFGSASDPTKTARFLALQRVYDRLASESLTPRRLAFGRGLTMVAEHTCGVDIKSYLRDEEAWDRDKLAAARKTDRRFAYSEASWAEQRAYLATAVEALDDQDRALAEAALAQLVPGAQAEAAEGKLSPLAIEGWTVAFDPATGDVVSIASPSGWIVEGVGGSLMGYRYESYDARDVDAHVDTYITRREEWAILDLGKPGLYRARTARSQTFVPRPTGHTETGAILELDAVAREELGAPSLVEICVRALDARQLEVAFLQRGKPANRMPEASFVTLTPAGHSNWEFCKTGLWQPGDRVAARGGGQLQAVSAARKGTLEVAPLDTPLVAPAGAPFMPFSKTPPDLSQGLRFNLHNNKWGTNFPQWWEGDLVARFILSVG